MTENDPRDTPPPPPAYSQQPMPPMAIQAEGSKSFVVAWLLSWLLGIFGIDRFYLGKVGTAILKFLTIGGLGVWVLVDIILILTGTMRDKSGYRLRGYDQYKVMAWIVTLVLVVLGAGYNVSQ
ncbi:TM2 domain-containing protein [Demequina soli]|uniref:TM2 domain-containing protein n=1 Tax=Demequina soli TaxID=1638987 RepID=UPI000AA8C8BE|nr:TM2 domain-containing protein [Demequina soli]